jgi:hypothetical protein
MQREHLAVRLPRCLIGGRRGLTRLAVGLLGVCLLAVALLGTACAGFKDSSQSGTALAATGAPTRDPVSPDEVRIVVSRSFGATTLRDARLPYEAGITVMRALASVADVETAYGGGFVAAINGVKSPRATTSDRRDWFYWVDGRMAEVGAGNYRLKGGETIWWDYHPWQGAGYIPVVVQAWPAPWTAGPLTLHAQEAAGPVADWARGVGLTPAQRLPLTERPTGPALVAATVAEAEQCEWLRDLLSDGSEAGIFVTIDGGTLRALDHEGEETGVLSAAVIGVLDPAAGQDAWLVLLGQDAASLLALTERFAAGIPGDYAGLGMRDSAVVRLPEEPQGQD